MSSVYGVKLPNGDLQIGVDVDGVFVPFADHSAGRVAQYVERGRTLAERAEQGDELARDQIGKPLEGKSESSSSTDEPARSELDEHAAELGVADYPADGTTAEKVAAIAAHESSTGTEG